MSDTEPVKIAIRGDLYDELQLAAVEGFRVLREKRDRLNDLMVQMVEKGDHHFVDDDIPLDLEDIRALWIQADNRLHRLAEALNHRLTPGAKAFVP